ncbi:MAG: aspartate/glutamate racemase family protein [Sciscionella sp.]|nr:aspartate/glutamate racemase family protein [Sciscionella sp.]
MTTVGFLYPGHAAEDDYPRMRRALLPSLADLELAVEHTYGEDLHAIDELLDLGSERRLADGAARLRAKRPAAVVWACTSGSFVYGWAGAREQADKLAVAAGVPASSTSFAFVDAAHALGVRRVAVVASYPDEVAGKFVEFLTSAGVDVIAMSSQGIDTAAEVGRLTDDDVLALAKANDNADADALLIPDTAMHTIATIDAIESAIGKPVLTANQVTVWHGLRLAGLSARSAEVGALFRAAHN